MAAALPFIATGLGLFGAVQSMGAASDARKQGRENAAAINAQTSEEARRLARQQLETEQRGIAAAAASGTGAGSTSQTAYLDQMRADHRDELAWLRKSGASRARAASQEGRMAGRQATAAAVGTLANTASNAYSYFGPKKT